MIGRNVPLAVSPRTVIPPNGPTSPWAEKSGLGWSILYAEKPTNSVCNFVSVRNPSTDENNDMTLAIAEQESMKDVSTKDLLRLLDQDFTDITTDERLGHSKEDDKFLRIVEKSINVTDGPYVMDLPFRHDTPRLENNSRLAHSSLTRLKKRLSSNAEYKDEYTAFMENSINNGHIEKVPDNQISNPAHYLTHHAVRHKVKKKLRVVFNASMKFNGTSLNDELYQGPDMLTNLTGALCRLKKHRIAFTCDIASMFMMVKVTPEQRDYLRILWYEDGDITRQPTEYRICYHLFGAVSSPACSIYALHQTARDNIFDFPKEVIDLVLKDFYMDDGTTSTDNVDTAVELALGAIDLCSRGGFDLCKFSSNSKQFLQRLPHDKRSPDLTEDFDFDLDHLPNQRTLGMIWNTEEDILQYKVDLPTKTLTRRNCLSSISTVFDPMGLISPVMLRGKRVLQEACLLKLPWDEPLHDHLQQDWLKWKKSIEELPDFFIPRCHKPQNFEEVDTYELHCFSDASCIGYGCCVYLRLKSSTEQIHVCLIMGKSRVAPIKVVTIPRLELNGAVIMASMAQMLQRELRIPDLHTYFWTDNTVVLGYLRNETRRFKTFVCNRIQRIHNITDIDRWFHVPGHLNPADLASRGMKTSELYTTNWLTGPDYLWNNDEFWHQPDSTYFKVEDNDTELKITSRAMKIAAKETTTSTTILTTFEKLGTWYKVKLTIAVWKHLINIFKSKRDGVQIDPVFRKTAKSLEDAEMTTIRLIQSDTFSEEMDVLTTASDGKFPLLKKSSQILRLNPFLDSNGILRVGGRIKHSSLSFEEKHLIIIPRRGHLTKLIVQHYHQRCCHGGRNMTLNLIRSRFWLINGPSVVRHFISDCVTCSKLRRQPLTQKMANLPVDRVTEAAPFTYSACDIFGPFIVKHKRSELKRYGLLFSCQASRAVHLEVLHSMTTDSFLCALRRFISRRGTVKVIRSDCGSQILGASSELQRLKDELKKQMLTDEILKQFDCDLEFSLSTPYAPHFHGAWERQIGTVRRILEYLLHQHKAQLTDEALETFLVEAEAVVNSRPLSVESITDPELKPLSPSNILTMKTGIVLPPPGNFVEEDMYLHKQWRKAQYMLNEFWTRWRKEMLQNYQERCKWNRPVRNLQVGDVVLMVDDNLNRNQWPMMFVQNVYPDNDGLVRKVDVATTNGDFNSPTKRKRDIYIGERFIS